MLSMSTGATSVYKTVVVGDHYRQITLTVTGDAVARLKKFASALSPESRKTANRQAAIQMHSDVIKTFEAEGAYLGRKRWADLKAGGRYVKVRSKKGKRSRWQGKSEGADGLITSYQILQDTGALRASFMPLSDEYIAGVGAVSTHRHADLAPIHEFGDPKRHLPARPMLPTAKRAVEIMTLVYGVRIGEAAKP